MNAVLVSGLTILAAATTPFFAPTPAGADEACAPRLIQRDTSFPQRSQLRGQQGTVHLAVLIDENGRAQSAQLHRSSGFLLLDRAAAQSALDTWVFDVSSCARKDLPARHVIAVEYHNDEY